MRNLNELEKEMLNRLVEKDFQGKEAIVKQIENAMAEDCNDNDNYGSILLHTGVKEAADVRDRIPVEALVADSDGTDVAILLHVVDGFINELELFKVDGSPLMQAIDPVKIRVSVN